MTVDRRRIGQEWAGKQPPSIWEGKGTAVEQEWLIWPEV